MSARAGLLLGLVTYTMDPLGGDKVATNPWLPGSASDPPLALAWVLLFCAPTAAAALAAGRCPVPSPVTASADRAWQGLAAGLVSGGAGALTAAVLGTGTTALMLKSAWLRGLLYHGQHLTASALYGRELYASMDLTFYGAVCIAFPLIAAVMGMIGAGLGALAGPRAGGGPDSPLEPGYPVGVGGR